VVDVSSSGFVEVLRLDVAGHLGPGEAGTGEMDFHLVARLHRDDRPFRSLLDVGCEHAVGDFDECYYLVAPFEGCHDSP
jgi:hypothetical protein